MAAQNDWSSWSHSQYIHHFIRFCCFIDLGGRCFSSDYSVLFSTYSISVHHCILTGRERRKARVNILCVGQGVSIGFGTKSYVEENLLTWRHSPLTYNSKFWEGHLDLVPIWGFYGLNFVSQNSSIEALTPDVMLFGDCLPLGRQLRFNEVINVGP